MLQQSGTCKMNDIELQLLRYERCLVALYHLGPIVSILLAHVESGSTSGSQPIRTLGSTGRKKHGALGMQRQH